MKKAFSIFLTLVFLASSIGLTINYHYCGVKLRSVSLTFKGCCCIAKAKMDKNCCKNEVKYVKITDDHSASSPFHFSKTDIAPLSFNIACIAAISHRSSPVFFKSHSPPPKFRDRVITFRSLLI